MANTVRGCLERDKLTKWAMDSKEKGKVSKAIKILDASDKMYKRELKETFYKAWFKEA